MARKTFTSTAVKNRWNHRHYDRVVLFSKKGEKEKYVAYAQAHGMSINKMFNTIIRDLMGVPEEEWKPQGVEPVAK